MKKLHLKKDTFAKISKIENINLSKKAERLFADFKKQNTPHPTRRQKIAEMFVKS